MIIPVILAGGSGTRLWPLSRGLYPKQMIKFTNKHTMFQNTILRLAGLDDISSPLVVCNEEYRFMVAEQLRNIDVIPWSIILEPVGRNTAPAIAAAALKILNDNRANDPLLLVLPADHVIDKISNFHAALEHGRYYADKGCFVTFGVIPDNPEPGYGYIQKGKRVDEKFDICEIQKFIEKPDCDTAEKYVNSGKFCWNSGMFMFKASAIIKELENQSSDIVNACRSAVEKGVDDLDFFRLDRKNFSQSPCDSIDYAVMEKTDKGVMVPFAAGWNDLGSWEALWQTGKKDDNLNVIKGDVLIHDVHNSYLKAETRLVAAVGVDNLIIVETGDAVLVASRDKVQEVKKLVEELKKNCRQEAMTHKKEYRPWGASETMDSALRFKVKRITLKPGAKLSLQQHFNRAEHWIIVSGTAHVIRGEKELILKEDQSTYIPVGVLHKIENPGKIPLELIEIQSGSYLGEDDIVRFDNVYKKK